MMTRPDTSALLAAARAATKGPWRVSAFEEAAEGKERVVMGADNYGVAWIMGRTLAEHVRDALFLSLANPSAIEALCLWLEKVERENAELRKTLRIAAGEVE